MSFVEFVQPKGPWNLLCSLILAYCIVSRSNGMVFKILISRTLEIFKNKCCNVFNVFESFFLYLSISLASGQATSSKFWYYVTALFLGGDGMVHNIFPWIKFDFQIF